MSANVTVTVAIDNAAATEITVTQENATVKDVLQQVANMLGMKVTDINQDLHRVRPGVGAEQAHESDYVQDGDTLVASRRHSNAA